MIVIPNTIEVILADALLAENPPWTLKLYGNNATPVAGSVAADFTEIAGGDYASKTLLQGTWVVTPGAPTVAAYPVQTFAFSGSIDTPGTVYGYFIVDSGGALILAERFDPAPFVPQLAGDQIEITPRITFGSEEGD